MLRRLLTSAGALLALFHAWLFASQFWDGRLDDPALLLRWLAAGGLVAGLVGLNRRGISIFRGRKATTIWLLAALLHGPAVVARIDGASALPEVAATLSQLAAASVAGIGLGLLVAAVRRAAPAAPRRSSNRLFEPNSAVRFAAALLAVSPRPPPASTA